MPRMHGWLWRRPTTSLVASRWPKRFVLRLGGIHGDGKVGTEELGRTASKGRYLKPFARVTLGLALLAFS